MLFPQLLPGSACSVESSGLSGAVLISKAVYSGDNWTGDFKIDIGLLSKPVCMRPDGRGFRKKSRKTLHVLHISMEVLPKLKFRKNSIEAEVL
jgi:hypothetical protein